jgi:hypothetical protein
MKKQETNNTPTAGGQYQSAENSKRDPYTSDRFRWLDQVAADPELPASAFKVAYAIATALKRNSGTTTLVSDTSDNSDIRELWIGCQKPAGKIAMARTSVLEMERNGHLAVDQGKRGSGHSHHYRLLEKCQPADILKCQPADICEKHKCQPTDIFLLPSFACSVCAEGCTFPTYSKLAEIRDCRIGAYSPPACFLKSLAWRLHAYNRPSLLRSPLVCRPINGDYGRAVALAVVASYATAGFPVPPLLS